MRLRSTLAAIAVAASANAALAADPRYPDWPCPQAKVPEISIAAVWAGPPIDDVGASWKDDAKVSALVTRLAARRIPLEEAQKDVADFLTGTADEKTRKGKLLFAGLFDTLNAQRTSVMNGLERVMRKQREAVDKVRGDTIKLQEMQSGATREEAKIEELSNQLNWETRIFEDRRRVMKFVCEVPTAIDQRLFALAREIQQDME
ncbi:MULTISPECIES: hypothetical protein [unclassified Bradyrhizobium]|uniref:hypothetical protein n=1 Tax=unclassified Bradyrhizobium TaxID=2631580 RepID=UPI0024E0FA73|nr:MULTISPECIES: hypothetical protein [unclassified Bradyrhizobium]